MKPHPGCAAAFALMIMAALPLAAQTPPPEPEPPHDITQVDAVPPEGAMNTPLPERQRRRLRKYETPELTGARQAIGSQLIGGELPRPILDYGVRTSAVEQRISFFEGGLVVIRLSGAGGTIHKRVIIPADALQNYLEIASAGALRKVRPIDVSPPSERRRAFLRIHEKDGTYVERTFDPGGFRPRSLQSQITPLEDLLRALSEDRTVTSTVANYEPDVGDELVADDRKVWRVVRIIDDSGIVELRCTSAPLIMYVAKKDLYNYFVGRPAEE
ncbi:MAG TPA: hypothetical protein VNA04_07960 [Thermoanaerobaculia bacterium]|nr:hypothetical protein [Thermoanaerobaculia bacterium]